MITVFVILRKSGFQCLHFHSEYVLVSNFKEENILSELYEINRLNEIHVKSLLQVATDIFNNNMCRVSVT